MAEHVSETVGFAQDLFSPLQYCEVVEDGWQHRRLQQHFQQLSQQQYNSMQLQLQKQHSASPKLQVQENQQNLIHESLPSSCNKSQQQQTQIQNEELNPEIVHKELSNMPVIEQSQTINSLEIKVSNSNSHLIKQEPIQLTTQSQQKVLDSQNSKSAANDLSNTSVGILISSVSNGMNISSPNPTLITMQQQEQLSQLYQVQLENQNLNQLELNSNIRSNTSSNQIENQAVEQITIPNIIGLQPSTTNIFSPLTSSISIQRNAVATQTNTQSDTNVNSPHIYFLNVCTAETEKDVKPLDSCKSALKDDIKIICEQVKEIKSIPVKRTWRRPWKKKKEREKKVAVKKARRVKKRRISCVTKKKTIRIDPRNGPPIDTSLTLVRRETEETINQLKQKRQRIKLNRNSGREYVNRLGKIVVARKIGPPCNCPLRCWDRMGSKILDIFNNFWDLCDFNLQNSYLFTCLKLCDVKRRYTKKPADESRRQNTFEYFVRICGKHLRVCKRAFMSAHGLTSDKRLRTLFTQMKDGALIPELDKRGKHLRPQKSPTRQSISNHFESSISQHTSGALSRTGKSTIHSTSTKSKKSTGSNRAKKSQLHRVLVEGKAIHHPMYPPPPTHPITHLHSHCTATPPTTHGVPQMQEHPHTYIPNGDIYFPHYIENPQSMPPPHISQIPNCQKMLETPAYFMAGMKENTFHQ